MIRNVTGSGMADAVEDFDLLTLDRKKTPEGLSFEIGGFSGKASFLVRVQEGSVIGSANGAAVQKVNGNLYLLEASSSHVDIILEQSPVEGGVQ